MTARMLFSGASWNRPAAELGEAVGMGDYVRRFLTHAWGREPSAQRRMQPKIADYSVSFFDARQATTTVRLAQSTVARQIRPTLGNVALGTAIPWNPAWAQPDALVPILAPNQLPGGTDRCAVVWNPDTGEAWEMWATAAPHGEGLDWPLAPLPLFKLFGQNGRAGFTPGDPRWMVVGTCFHHANVYASDGLVDGRGMGISKLALTVRLDELEDGRIGHPLAGVFTNPMAGPAASPINSTLDPEAGRSRVFFLAPGRKAEYLAPRVPAPENTYPIGDALPTGIRFALRISDAQIDAWLDAVHGDSPLRPLARTFATALRDYGWVYAETGGYAVGIECESARVPAAATRYRALGVRLGASVTGTPLGELLSGIWDYGTVYVVKAA